MNKIISLSAALALTLGLSQASLAQGRSDDKGRGPDKQAAADDAQPGKGKGKDRGANQVLAQGGGADKDKGKGQGQSGKGQADKDDRPGQAVLRQADRKPDQPGQGAGKGQGQDKDRDQGRERDRDDDDRLAVFGGYGDGRGLIAGCPPGLAKRNNGCLPPGQERKLERARYDRLWGRSIDGFSYRYSDGYLYRYDRQGGLLGYLPALAGALGIGNFWPNQYRYDPAPRYQTQYYRLNDPYDYRYADGAIYGVDPQTQAIRQVVALLTGQSAAVGQRMPSGYDVYNVPYPYRDRYYDTPEHLYRYNDGAVYQLDPTTQVVLAIIQLLD